MDLELGILRENIYCNVYLNGKIHAPPLFKKIQINAEMEQNKHVIQIQK